MILAEFESGDKPEISVFHRLKGGNGTNPLRLVSCPTDIPAQVPGLWANAAGLDDSCRVNSKNAARRYLTGIQSESDQFLRELSLIRCE
jgi:hypothetical protein